MPVKFITAFALTILMACNSMGSSEGPTREQVNGLIARWLTLWSSYDTRLIDEIFWQDSSMTYFSSEKRGLIKGFNKMKPHHEGFGFVEGGKQPVKELWLEDIDVTMHDNFATVGASWYFGDRSVPKDSVQSGPVTFVVIKGKDGTARIAHTHFANY